ncbi:hypothetical protein [Candidatus Enterovibrio altilux]|uniref:Uncharacterized protein n=1 Tax=Candidatus Enterovibrio altilux TaxID=1927128 RepID=A0A291BAR8_9GAMM|nr:hypothetical protein BTN50_1651 [Candidatus Enterovibrio luxaltus]
MPPTKRNFWKQGMVIIDAPYQRRQGFELKKLLKGTLILRDYHIQINETYVMTNA